MTNFQSWYAKAIKPWTTVDNLNAAGDAVCKWFNDEEDLLRAKGATDEDLAETATQAVGNGFYTMDGWRGTYQDA